MRSITAPHCQLEPQTAAHAPEMYSVLSDPAIYEFENEPPRSLEQLSIRFAKLETRASPDGTEQWLNWVIRLPDGDLAGYVQATVLPDGLAFVAYELNSQHWRKGIGSSAVRAQCARSATSITCGGIGESSAAQSVRNALAACQSMLALPSS